MHPHTIVLARWTLGTIWLAAAWAKLAKPTPMSEIVAGFHLLPGRAASAIGMVLPWLELTLGTLLILGQWTTWSAKASIGALAVFTVAIVVNLLRGNRLECNCFGQWGARRISWWSVVRNLVLCTIGAVIALQPSAYLSADAWWNGSTVRSTDPPLRDFIPVFLMALAGGLLWLVGVSTWHAAGAVVRAEAWPGQVPGQRERLRRLLRSGPAKLPQAALPSSGGG